MWQLPLQQWLALQLRQLWELQWQPVAGWQQAAELQQAAASQWQLHHKR
jgi:hypothetical protein